MITAETIRGPEDLKGLSAAELEAFAGDVRRFLLENVSRTGGHIGANLGTVELTVALHTVFDSPRDAMIWDTGHQGYTHKIITNRAGMFPTLNRYGGMNRFLSHAESEHDPIEASHAGTSISVALGLALSRKLSGSADYTIAVIGDGALAEGMALEALNHAVVEDTRLVLVLNDNGYAISPGFGGLHELLQREDGSAYDFFTALGLEYIGPVDGHDIDALLESLERTRYCKRVPIVHAKTVKGHGWKPADRHPFRQHFSFAFDPETGEPSEASPQTTYPDVAASAIAAEMREDPSIVCLTPSTLYATGLAPVFEEFPDRTFDPGMEEQHALTMTVGLALGGMKPVIAYQSTFLQRAFDQLIHDVCFTRRPTLILGFRSGFSGYDNPTHHGIYDFSYLRGVPNLEVLYPKDRYEAERMVRDNLRRLESPVMILMPYGPVEAFDPDVLHEPAISFARAEVVEPGEDLLLVAVGHKYRVAREVTDELRARGVRAQLVNLRYLKPLPDEQLLGLMAAHSRVVTLEEAVLDGGVGSAIAALAADFDVGCEFLRVGVPTSLFVEPGSNEELSRIYGLSTEQVRDEILIRWPELARQVA